MKSLAKQMEALQGRLDIQIKTNDMLLDRLRLQTKIIEEQHQLILWSSGLGEYSPAMEKLRDKIAELKNELEK